MTERLDSLRLKRLKVEVVPTDLFNERFSATVWYMYRPHAPYCRLPGSWVGVTVQEAIAKAVLALSTEQEEVDDG